MYGGRRITIGDTIYLFASGSGGDAGLVARGIVTASREIPKRPGLERQTPRVSIEVRKLVRPRRPLGHAEIRSFADRSDGRAETEIHFRFYRQATPKIGGISAATARFLERRFTLPKAKLRRPRATGRARGRRH
jgi:hypothetical protein